MKKLSRILLVFVMLSVLLTSCYDAIEPDEEVYTVVIGIDKGVNNKVKFTIQFPSYREGGSSKKASSGGGGSEADAGEVTGTLITTVEAPTALEGLNLINTSIPRRVPYAFENTCNIRGLGKGGHWFVCKRFNQ